MLIHGTILAPLSAALAGIFFASAAVAQENSNAGAEFMAKVKDLVRTGESYQLLAGLAGTWDYKMTNWDETGADSEESTGTETTKPTLDGHYFITDLSGKLPIQGADGKTVNVDYKGISIDGYDVVKQKFVSSWIDNMRTNIIMAEGTYDPATKIVTYHYEYTDEWAQGVKTVVRQTLKILDQDHHVYDSYEMHGGVEVKTLEMSFTRQH